MKLATVFVLATISLNLQPPKLGDTVSEAAVRAELEHHFDSAVIQMKSSVVTGSSQTRPAYHLDVGDTRFTLGSDSEMKIVYIWTASESFQTPGRYSRIHGSSK